MVSAATTSTLTIMKNEGPESYVQAFAESGCIQRSEFSFKELRRTLKSRRSERMQISYRHVNCMASIPSVVHIIIMILFWVQSVSFLSRPSLFRIIGPPPGNTSAVRFILTSIRFNSGHCTKVSRKPRSLKWTTKIAYYMSVLPEDDEGRTWRFPSKLYLEVTRGKGIKHWRTGQHQKNGCCEWIRKHAQSQVCWKDCFDNTFSHINYMVRSPGHRRTGWTTLQYHRTDRSFHGCFVRHHRVFRRYLHPTNYSAFDASR